MRAGTLLPALPNLAGAFTRPGPFSGFGRPSPLKSYCCPLPSKHGQPSQSPFCQRCPLRALRCIHRGTFKSCGGALSAQLQSKTVVGSCTPSLETRYASSAVTRCRQGIFFLLKELLARRERIASVFRAADRPKASALLTQAGLVSRPRLSPLTRLRTTRRVAVTLVGNAAIRCSTHANIRHPSLLLQH